MNRIPHPISTTIIKANICTLQLQENGTGEASFLQADHVYSASNLRLGNIFYAVTVSYKPQQPNTSKLFGCDWHHLM
jgi:hypothetical protein